MVLVHAGIRRKVVAAHSMNAASSRSHCILTLEVESAGRWVWGSGVLVSCVAMQCAQCGGMLEESVMPGRLSWQ